MGIVAGYEHYELLLATPDFTTIFRLLLMPLLDTMIRGLAWHLQPPITGEGAVSAGHGADHNYRDFFLLAAERARTGAAAARATGPELAHGCHAEGIRWTLR